MVKIDLLLFLMYIIYYNFYCKDLVDIKYNNICFFIYNNNLLNRMLFRKLGYFVLIGEYYSVK